MKKISSKLRAAGLMAALALMMGWGAQSHACTNLIAGKKATVDGSTIITYAADSHTLFGFLEFIPAAHSENQLLLKPLLWIAYKEYHKQKRHNTYEHYNTKFYTHLISLFLEAFSNTHQSAS